VTLQYIGDGSNLNVVNGFDTAMGEPISYFKLESGTFSNYSIALPNFQYGVPFWQPQILNYAVPLILPLVILGTTMNLTSLCIVTETPLPRLVLTPSGKKDFIISKLFAYSIVMLIQIAETFTCINIFGLYCRGSLLDFFLSLLLVGFTGICMGMAVSAVANTSQQANQMFIALFIMLALFSNAFISVDSLPSIFHSIAIIFPLTHAIPLVRDITLRGLPLTLAGAAPLLILSFVYLLIAYIAFARKKVEV
jgi:ABC-type multidrug transport system permease subunit